MMEEEVKRNHGGRAMNNHGGRIMEESWRGNHGGCIMEESSLRSKPGGGSQKEEVRKRQPIMAMVSSQYLFSHD